MKSGPHQESHMTTLVFDGPADQEPAGSGHRKFARIGYTAIAVVFGGFGVWATLAPLDSAAIAPGRVAVETNRKPVQHLEGGIVREILVEEAQKVEAGQVLVRLQPVQAQANSDGFKKQLDAALAQEARLLAEQRSEAAVSLPPELIARLSIPETALAVADQQRTFSERRRSLENQVEILKARIEQTERDISGRSHRANALQSQLDSFNIEIGKVSGLADKGFFPRNKLLGLERERSRITGELGLTRDEMARMRETIEEARLQIRAINQNRKEEVAQQLAEVRTKLSDLKEKTTIAEDVLKRIEVRAPRAGIVQALKVHAIGEVVKPGETIAEVIPVEDKLVLEARVSPLDIQSVTGGQRAQVRFPAFSTREAPTVFGRVEKISADSLIDEVTKHPYYSAKVVIDQGTIPPYLAKQLVPGMPADVIITTGERTLLQYLVGPMQDALFKTMRER
jgi:HlyD family secretion protein